MQIFLKSITKIFSKIKIYNEILLDTITQDIVDILKTERKSVFVQHEHHITLKNSPPLDLKNCNIFSLMINSYRAIFVKALCFKERHINNSQPCLNLTYPFIYLNFLLLALLTPMHVPQNSVMI